MHRPSKHFNTQQMLLLGKWVFFPSTFSHKKAIIFQAEWTPLVGPLCLGIFKINKLPLTFTIDFSIRVCVCFKVF